MNFGFSRSHQSRLKFENPEGGVRKIVLATNMAETSITINDVVFVVDCGKAKETSYDALNNTPCLLPSWISKVAVWQRRGRAGCVQPGCRLSMLPVEPKLDKMLILGAIFNCLDHIMTVVAGLSVRDPFVMSADK
ncbi:hypothetical protein AHAS_Ahas09G0042200 [Arachis hypogaea]